MAGKGGAVEPGPEAPGGAGAWKGAANGYIQQSCSSTCGSSTGQMYVAGWRIVAGRL